MNCHDLTPKYKLAEAFAALKNTSFHVFLTGNAGTGKSTLINTFVKENEGRCIVLAPTGIAAVNIQGQTIHRFCHLPARTVSYSSIKHLDPYKDAEKLKIIHAAKYIIIDEVSMVRADLMDSVYWFFLKNFPNDGPFAGKKLILVGDLDQLPPVVANDEDREMIKERYLSKFFFDASCWKKSAGFKTIKLTHVFRQSDPKFIELLNSIKNNTLAPWDLDGINRKCIKPYDYIFKPEVDGVMLCAVNRDVSFVNSEMLARLPGENQILAGTIEGQFDPKNCTAEININVKIGCRIMVLRNDPEGHYFNGTIGTLIEANTSAGYLKIKLDNGKECFVPRYTFEQIEYKYNSATDRINVMPVGKFIQFPVKVAYALSIHKSQGQTFEKIIVDMGDYGAFEHGQLYVALSRCKSLEGISLRKPLTSKDLIYDKHIMEFNKRADEAPEACVICQKPFSDENVKTQAGWKEIKISGMCETCFDRVTEEDDEFEASEDDLPF